MKAKPKIMESDSRQGETEQRSHPFLDDSRGDWRLVDDPPPLRVYMYIYVLLHCLHQNRYLFFMVCTIRRRRSLDPHFLRHARIPFYCTDAIKSKSGVTETS